MQVKLVKFASVVPFTVSNSTQRKQLHQVTDAEFDIYLDDHGFRFTHKGEPVVMTIVPFGNVSYAEVAWDELMPTENLDIPVVVATQSKAKKVSKKAEA